MVDLFELMDFNRDEVRDKLSELTRWDRSRLALATRLLADLVTQAQRDLGDYELDHQARLTSAWDSGLSPRGLALEH